jgi:hypothetical protein
MANLSTAACKLKLLFTDTDVTSSPKNGINN